MLFILTHFLEKKYSSLLSFVWWRLLAPHQAICWAILKKKVKALLADSPHSPACSTMLNEGGVQISWNWINIGKMKMGGDDHIHASPTFLVLALFVFFSLFLGIGEGQHDARMTLLQGFASHFYSFTHWFTAYYTYVHKVAALLQFVVFLHYTYLFIQYQSESQKSKSNSTDPACHARI